MFTDGSVNAAGQTAGAAYVWGTTGGAWTLPGPCSSTQAEMAAIQQALQVVRANPANKVAILTDSLAAIKTIENRAPKHFKALTAAIRNITAHLQHSGKQVNFVWTLRHIRQPKSRQPGQNCHTFPDYYTAVAVTKYSG